MKVLGFAPMSALDWIVKELRRELSFLREPRTYDGDLLADLRAAGGEIETDENDPRLHCDQMKKAAQQRLIEWAYVGGPGSTKARMWLTSAGLAQAQGPS